MKTSHLRRWLSRLASGPCGVDTVVKVLDSFAVFKPGEKTDVASTYDMAYVRQAMKDLKLP